MAKPRDHKLTNLIRRLEEEPRGYHFAERIFGSIPEIIFTFRATPFLAQSGHTLVLASPPIGCIPFEGPTESVHAQDSATDQFWVRLCSLACFSSCGS